MTTILVTGCAGFIGSHLSEKLLELNYQVVGVDNFDPFYPAAIKKENMAGFIQHPNFHFHELDLRESGSLDYLNESVDLIVHLAGKAGVRPSIEDPQAYIDSNITATRNILDFMRTRKIQKLAFASSSSVYGNCQEVPFTETMNVDKAISPYAFTKKSCEVLNHTYHHLYDLDIINMRFFTVFGPRQRPDLAIRKFVRLISNQETIPMFGDGSTARDYTYVDDTVDGIVKCCNYLFDHESVFDTINLGNSYPILLSTMIETIGKTLGISPKIEQLPMQPGDVDQTFADISKAKNLIGYNPKTSFETGIQNFVNWFHQNQEK
ncbi:GDP-mannose 4,6-dehydratase [Ancylomarina longa]|uniref:NAD-dependent epimerase/dehydratase family protein n=1 Tax=Ancylomarina longa TaxID=2487017 RepID=A0A434AWU1_9BACT|nr:GDP-mannose 4,6-dehydratase [Ancylomarina longa]RUT78870.1 NAD-dependent epimerase/dehydratase family protein [Ancylomarina longa]